MAWRRARPRQHRYMEAAARRHGKRLHAPDAFQRLRRRQGVKPGGLDRRTLHGIPGRQDQRSGRRRLWSSPLLVQEVTAFTARAITLYFNWTDSFRGRLSDDPPTRNVYSPGVCFQPCLALSKTERNNGSISTVTCLLSP